MELSCLCARAHQTDREADKEFNPVVRTDKERSPDWESDVESWSESEGLSSSGFRKHIVESLALYVIGLLLEDWNLRGWHQVVTWPWTCCQERPGSWGCCYQEACCHCKECLLSPWTGCDSKGEGCGERLKEEGT